MQQSLGDPSVDVILSPAPIHKHSGGIIQDCYSKPENLYNKLCKQLGRSFNLFHYWGPLSSIKATRWIADATAAVMQDADLAPDLLFTYLPHLDYILQKRGPASGEKLQKAFRELQVELEKLVVVAAETGYDVLLCSDYAITDAKRAVFPNIVLAENNLFRLRKVKGRTYPDLYSSPAIAVCDHQVAHIYLRDKSLLPQVLEIFEAMPGVDSVLRNGVAEHDNAGDLILISNPDCWFAYPWWNDRAEAPDYAGHVDIHNKIGFDPCELFLDSWIPPRTSQKTELVGGSHGRTDSPVFFATNLQFEEQPETFLEMVAALQKRLI
ncbi:MAG: alkaline phosphatase family protein [Lentisphaeria bacterium]